MRSSSRHPNPARRPPRRAVRLGLLVALALGTAGPAHAAVPLRLVAPTATSDRPALVALDEAADGTRSGVLVVVVRNESARRARLRVRFLPQSGGAGYRVRAANASRPAAVAFDAAGETPQLAGGAVGQLALRFRLGDDQRLSNVAGQLVVAACPVSPNGDDGRGGRGGTDRSGARAGARGRTRPRTTPRPSRPARPAEPLVIAVRAQPAAPPDVAPIDDPVTIQTTQWLPGEGPQGGEARVELGGQLASATLADEDLLDGVATLRSGGGNSVRVSWHVAGAGEDRHALVEVHGHPAPGRYSGTLPLNAAAADPNVSVVVNARAAVWWPLLAVLLGTLCGLVAVAVPLRTRRKTLRLWAMGVILQYREWRAEHRDPAGYNLDDVIPREGNPWDEREPLPMPRQSGVRGLFSSIYWARNRVDLDEDADWATELSERVARWRRVEEQAQALLSAIDKVPPNRPEGRRFAQTRTAEDSLALLYEARDTEPTADDTADDLRHRLKRQAEWHSGVADAWRAYVEVYDRLDEDLKRPLADDLDALACPDTSVASRTPEEHRRLLVRLEALRHRLHERGAPRSDAVETGPALMVPARSGLLGGALVLPDTPQVPSAGTSMAVPAAAQVAQALAPGRPVAQPLDDSKGWRRAIRNGLRSARRVGLGLTLGIAAAAAVVYVSTIYDDTWGSLVQFLTAFGAGFGSRVVVDWAVLPAFASLRLRRARAREQTDEGEGESTADQLAAVVTAATTAKQPA
jgi:hypothetical protein